MAHSNEAPQPNNEDGKNAGLRQRVAAFARKVLFAEGSVPARVNPTDKIAVPPTISGAGLAPVPPVIDTPKGGAPYRPSAADRMGVISGDDSTRQEPATTRHGAAEAGVSTPYTARNFPLGEAAPAVAGSPNDGYPQGGSDMGRRETLFDDGGNLPPASSGVVIAAPEDVYRAYPDQRPYRGDTHGVIATGASAPYHQGPYTPAHFPHGEYSPAVLGHPTDGYQQQPHEPFAPPEGLFPPDASAQPPTGTQ